MRTNGLIPARLGFLSGRDIKDGKAPLDGGGAPLLKYSQVVRLLTAVVKPPLDDLPKQRKPGDEIPSCAAKVSSPSFCPRGSFPVLRHSIHPHSKGETFYIIRPLLA